MDKADLAGKGRALITTDIGCRCLWHLVSNNSYHLAIIAYGALGTGLNDLFWLNILPFTTPANILALPNERHSLWWACLEGYRGSSLFIRGKEIRAG